LAKEFRLRESRALEFKIEAVIGSAIPDGEVQFSEDGASWLTLVSLPGPRETTGNFPVETYSFPETTAKFYRVVLRPPAPNPQRAQILSEHGLSLPSGRSVNLTEVDLSGPRVDHWEGKAAFGNTIEFRPIRTPQVAKTDAVARESVVDLTPKVQSDGRLD